jgi:hypothetical protein
MSNRFLTLLAWMIPLGMLLPPWLWAAYACAGKPAMLIAGGLLVGAWLMLTALFLVNRRDKGPTVPAARLRAESFGRAVLYLHSARGHVCMDCGDLMHFNHPVVAVQDDQQRPAFLHLACYRRLATVAGVSVEPPVIREVEP